MNRTWNQETYPMQWIHLLFWLALLAGVCATTAWGAPYPYDRDDRRDRAESRTRDSETDFIQRMMDYEAAGVAIARAAADRTKHGDMRDYLDTLERQGRRRIDRLQVIMDTRYGRRVEPRVDPKYEQRAKMFRQSDLRGAEFEIRLLKTLIDLNQEESAMAERALPRLGYSELQSMASTVLNKRGDTANQLQGWLKKWYDISYTSDIDTRPRRSEGYEYYRNR